MKKKLPVIILVIVIITGLSLLLYPTVSDYWNSMHQSRAIASYDASVQKLSTTDYSAMLDAARKYNAALAKKADRYHPTAAEEKEYESLLNVNGDGVMGYVEIPKINVSLPIYHGTDDGVLQVAIGHLVGSSLPVGGAGTHCVISGHRGLPSAKLFTNLDQLESGDTFQLHVLNETLTYQVDQIRIVLPDQVGDLAIVDGQDYCTLVTCTPYGVNTHRLLVRGHRIPTENAVAVAADAMQVDPVVVAPAVAAPILVALLVCVLVRHRKRRGISK